MNETKNKEPRPVWAQPENWLFLCFLLFCSVCWTTLRFDFSISYDHATYQQIHDFAAAVPYGKRVLAPLLAHLLIWLSSPVFDSPDRLQDIYGFIEICGVVALCLGLQRIFRRFGNKWMSFFSALGIFAVLPWLFLVTRVPWLYPWDIPSMAFVAWGMWAVLDGRWKTLSVLMVFASLNRESAMLLSLMWLVFWAGRKPWGHVIGIAILLFAIHAFCQAAIATTLADNIPAESKLWGGVNLKYEDTWLVLFNWEHVHNFHNVLWLFSVMAGLPLAFALMAKRIPPSFRGFGLVAWVYFWMLMIVGMMVESRIYGEISVLLYVPVTLCGWEMATGRPMLDKSGSPAPRWVVILLRTVAVAMPLAVGVLGLAFAHGCPS